MRQLTISELATVGAGMKDLTELPGLAHSMASTAASYIKPELLFGAIALALFLSPAGWSMTITGAGIGAAAGFAYGQMTNEQT